VTQKILKKGNGGNWVEQSSSICLLYIKPRRSSGPTIISHDQDLHLKHIVIYVHCVDLSSSNKRTYDTLTTVPGLKLQHNVLRPKWFLPVQSIARAQLVYIIFSSFLDKPIIILLLLVCIFLIPCSFCTPQIIIRTVVIIFQGFNDSAQVIP
jgi:hypothetical protein